MKATMHQSGLKGSAPATTPPLSPELHCAVARHLIAALQWTPSDGRVFPGCEHEGWEAEALWGESINPANYDRSMASVAKLV
eukprot:CAMPEP_0172711482 /NCGR_PEP_ID=MMETSP1074-20121228/59263_1 /TAXON_ID=2916 /ORGANISM="Ceratium fusus, Strain PA161109" /LENGTH=81 /DNA_ID=CAMNT_0013535173 /DNA_START=146 /DNA_END=392 /DNA_ORIENTATION=+